MPTRHVLKTLALGLALLLAVYIPTFALVSGYVMATAPKGSAPLGLQAKAIPLVMATSLVTAMLIMVGRRGSRLALFGFRMVGARSMAYSLAGGAALALLWRGVGAVLAIEAVQFPGLTGWRYLALFWIVAPIQEEIIFRGLLQTTLQDGIGHVVAFASWRLSVAALLTTAVFSLVHLGLLTQGAGPGATVFVVAGAFVLGGVAGQLRWETGSLAPAIVVHAVFNIVASV
jgi:membrane protease YdiL (CAAX protease family)